MGSIRIGVRRYPAVALTVLVGLSVVGLSVAGLAEAGRWTATVYVAGFIVRTAIDMVRAVLRGSFGLDILAVVAMAATLLVGEYVASLIVVLMLSGGQALEDYAAGRARRELTALLDRAPQTAHVLVDPDGAYDTVRDVPVDAVAIGDVLLVRPSELVPVDGEMLSERGEFDESSLTGESMPVAHEAGDELLSGAVNGHRAVRLRVLRPSSQSQYQQIVALVQEAESAKAPIVRLADRYAVPFTIVSLVIAAVAWMVSGEPVRFAEVLVLATPCPLLIAAPVAFLGGQSQASRKGVIVKGGAVLEQLARVRSAAFDKTGTVTQGHPVLVDVRPANGFAADELLAWSASAEQYSTHALADGVRSAALERGLELRSADEAQEEATNGVSARFGTRRVIVGKPAYIASLVPELVVADLRAGEAAAYVAIDGAFAGSLILADDERPESAAVVKWLRDNDFDCIAMLTGDARATAEAIAGRVGIEEVHAELLPQDKVGLAATIQPRPVLMVGDGVNDAPVLAAADVGVAMGAKGATAAGEAADAVILSDSLAKVVDAVRIGRHTLKVANTAIWIGIALSIGLMLVATTGAIPAVAGALTQEVVDLATILYALRALSAPKGDGVGSDGASSAPAELGTPDSLRVGS